MKIDNKTQKEITFGVMAATLAMTLGVTLYSHSESNHLTSKCPYAFIFGDKVIEHSINEVNKHTEYETVDIFPEDCKYDPNTCLWYTVENGQDVVTFGDWYYYYTIYGIEAEHYGINAHTTTGYDIDDQLEDQIEEQVKSLYR